TSSFLFQSTKRGLFSISTCHAASSVKRRASASASGSRKRTSRSASRSSAGSARAPTCPAASRRDGRAASTPSTASWSGISGARSGPESRLEANEHGSAPAARREAPGRIVRLLRVGRRPHQEDDDRAGERGGADAERNVGG